MVHLLSKDGMRRIPYKIMLFAAAILFLAAAAYYFLFFRVSQPLIVPSNLPEYTAAALSRYNGEKSDLPIYIALDGYVYDVTAGKSYYVPGGTYHSIAGKDASRELHMFGGDIVKGKYPVVGIFIPAP